MLKVDPVLIAVSVFSSIAFAVVIGGLLDYGFFQTYLIALTSFTLSDPRSYFVVAVLYPPLSLALISLARWRRSILKDTES